MAEQHLLWAETFEAAADLSGKQYRIVRQSAANLVNQASDAANSATIGVLQNKPTSGKFATVGILGITKVVAGAAITQGAVLSTDSSGAAITVVSGAMAIGRALATAGALNDIIPALIHPPVRWAGAP